MDWQRPLETPDKNVPPFIIDPTPAVTAPPAPAINADLSASFTLPPLSKVAMPPPAAAP